ncbi:MAG: 4Fe-4S dicluster domain-containing protein [Dehalococcoidales bacterium]|nr:4Fe-4S dicluster domain-containing protein [Dehalococcoidales bacterium]
MTVDLSKCVRCYACIAACRIEHYLPMGISWPRLVAMETGGDVPTVATYSVRCNQCQDAPCVDVCPTGATSQRDDGIIVIDQDKCVGCRYCVIACPYQNRTFLSKDKDRGFFPGKILTDFEIVGKQRYPHQTGTTEKCNFCAERIDAGICRGLTPGKDRDATPACVNTCPARALKFGDLDDPDSDISVFIRENDGFQLHPEYDTDPSIYFIDRRIGYGQRQPDKAGSHHNLTSTGAAA